MKYRCLLSTEHGPHDWWHTTSGGGHVLDGPDYPGEKNVTGPHHCPGSYARTVGALLTVDQVAEQISMSRWSVLDKINAKELPAINVGGQGTGTRWRIEPAALEQWLEKRRVAA